MNRQRQKPHGKSGGILLIVMLIMLTVSILGIGLYKLQETAGVGMVYARQSEQAFWLAEAGLQDAIQRLNINLSNYRNNPSSFTISYGKGSYQVSIPNVEADIFASIPTTNYTIVSVGRVRTMNRRVQQIVSASPGSKYCFEVLRGEAVFKSNNEIHGSGLVHTNASIDTGNNSTVVFDGYLFADSESISGNGSYMQADVPPVNQTTMDTSKYTTRINDDIASYVTNAPGNITYPGLTVASGETVTSASNLTFSGGTTFNGPVYIYANGTVTIPNQTTLPAGSVVVAQGNINIGGQTTIGGGVHIYTLANVDFGNQMTFLGEKTVVYADQNLTIAGGADSSVDKAGSGIAFLANGDISINANMNPFKGIIFSNTGIIDLNANIDICGTVIGELGFSVSSNVDFFFDPTVYDWDLAGIGITFADAILTKKRWQELPPL